ncbi:hypothetical protein I546_3181 [Mycobacterium kansasii 732]|nr:hypothetical protein I546_3181 [Mycobacterium kansasii 732]
MLVNLGYGDPAHGYSTGPADVPTPFGLFPPVDPQTVLAHLVTGTQQGITGAGSDLGALATQGWASLSGLSLLDVSQALSSNPLSGLESLATAISSGSPIDKFIMALQAANTDITNAFTNAVTNAYATVQPTIGIGTALLTSLPSYDVNLFLNGILQAANGAPIEGLINAIGMPIAATAGLVTLLAGYELLVLTGAWHPPPTPL